MKPRYIAGILALAVVYLIAAKLGLSLAFGVKQITSVWPPSGLALAALVVYGFRFWPGVLLGAFAANLLTSEPAGVALGIAAGNTLEALAGAMLLRRLVRFRPELDQIKSVIALVGLSALVSTLVSATIGSTSLVLGGLLPAAAQPSSWLLWWFGDMAGVLLFAPVLLVWQRGWQQGFPENIAEFAALLTSTAVVSALIFFQQINFLGSRPQVTFIVFPFIIWAAFRFKQLGVTAVSLILSIAAVMGTATGHGPFAGSGSVQQQLVNLLMYVILISASGLFMAVAVLEREAYAQMLLRQAEELKIARDKILRELGAKTKNEQRLQDSNERITGILSQLMEDGPRRPKRS